MGTADPTEWLRHLLTVRRAALPREDVAVLLHRGAPVTILERIASKQWRCGLWPVPFIEPMDPRRTRELLDGARRELSAQAIYFPNLDARHHLTSTLRQLPGVASWERLPSPVVEPPFDARDIWHRVVERLGARATRRARKFDRAGLSWKELHGAEAVAALSLVEASSWKSAARSSMHQWDHQFATYSQLITSGLIRCLFVLDRERPVAHVSFASLADVVLMAKWSFDDSYRPLSPGFNLLTRGFWETVDLASSHLVDLYGSPDPLKDLLETDRRPRVDVAWPDGPAVSSLRRERLSHDASKAGTSPSGQLGTTKPGSRP